MVSRYHENKVENCHEVVMHLFSSWYGRYHQQYPRLRTWTVSVSTRSLYQQMCLSGYNCLTAPSKVNKNHFLENLLDNWSLGWSRTTTRYQMSVHKSSVTQLPSYSTSRQESDHELGLRDSASGMSHSVMLYVLMSSHAH